jgi:glycine oxidase
MEKTDVIIVGGGLIGMFTAKELRAAGANVTLLDRQDTGREATWAGGGILSPLYPWRYPDAVTQLASWSQNQYPSIALELEQETGLSTEHTQNGLLILDNEEIEQALTWSQRHQNNLQLIDHNQIAALEPNWHDCLDQGIWIPEIAQIRNPRIAKALRISIELRGVKVLTFTSVEDLIVKNNKTLGVQTANGPLYAERVVLCTGAWTRNVLASSHSLLPDIEPIRGQMILFKGEAGLLQRITLYKDRYTIPRRDGRILIGSTLEQAGFNKEITETAREELYQVAIQRFPVLAQVPIEHHWSGLRPSSPLGIPYIGSHPEIDGLFVNSGHYRNGVVLAPASARLACDLLLERKSILDPSPYALTAPR